MYILKKIFCAYRAYNLLGKAILPIYHSAFTFISNVFFLLKKAVFDITVLHLLFEKYDYYCD